MGDRTIQHDTPVAACEVRSALLRPKLIESHGTARRCWAPRPLLSRRAIRQALLLCPPEQPRAALSLLQGRVDVYSACARGFITDGARRRPNQGQDQRAIGRSI